MQGIWIYYHEITGTLGSFFRDLGDDTNYFDTSPSLRPPLAQKRTIKPDLIRILTKLDLHYPEIVFGIGGFKTKMSQGFEEFKTAISNHRTSMLNSTGNFFPDGEWSPIVMFALLLRKYIYQTFLCGTDRIFLSDYQTFSRLFKYEIVDGKMIIDCYVIHDPETVEHGITLKSATAGRTLLMQLIQGPD